MRRSHSPTLQAKMGRTETNRWSDGVVLVQKALLPRSKLSGASELHQKEDS
jgi:hypothetical protein